MEFRLYGKIEGSSTKYVVLTYINYFKEQIVDTIPLFDNKFEAKGVIGFPTQIFLKGSEHLGLEPELNKIRIFIEPKDNYINLIENKFNEAEIIGSKTQNEYEELEIKTKPTYLEIDSLMSMYDELSEKMKLYKDINEIEDSLEIIETKWKKKLDKIRGIRLQYSWENPNSYLSIFWVNNYFTKIPKDSAILYHSRFKRGMLDSQYGRKLTKLIEISKPSSIGDLSPKFNRLGYDGTLVSIDSLKGKYVLLNFWASWCEPCRNSIPELSRLFNTYNPKGLEIIALSIDNSEEAWRNSIETNNIENWHHLKIGRNSPISIAYNTNEIPNYVLIGKDGIIINRKSKKKNFGLIELEEELRKIFK